MFSRVLISGGTGYLASNLINSWENNTPSIFIIDRTIKETIKCKDNMDFYLGSILSGLDNIYYFRPDICIHSAYAGDIHSEYEFLKFLAKSFPNIYLVYFSSAAVYGDREKAFVESDEPQPNSDYGRYKLELEKFIQANFKKHLILRISNPYGKEIKAKGVYKCFQDQLSKGDTITINADFPGEITRDFIYIEDFAKMVNALIDSEATGIFNISSGRGKTLEEFASETNPGRQIKVNYAGYKDEIRYSVLDNSKASGLLIQ